MKKDLILPKLERVPLLWIYKEDDKIVADIPEEIINVFELYGFLKIFVGRLEDRLYLELKDEG